MQPFVSCYSLRSFNSGPAGLFKPMFAVHESYMTFFVKGNGCEWKSISGIKDTKLSHTLVNVCTASQGGTYYTGDFVILSVQFKGNGISSIFDIPQRVLVNSILSLDDILGNESNLLAEQLASQPDMKGMSDVMNWYLLKKLFRHKLKPNTDAVCAASDIILKNNGIVSIDYLARHVNMSFRNFERRFNEEVGMSPKLYARITRFFTALEDKALHPHKSWMDITYEYKYSDQAHFIREVKTFSFRTPDELFKVAPPVPETYITKVEY